MKITNTTRGTRVVSGEMTLAAGETITVDPKAWAEAKKHPIVAAWVKSGELAEDAGKPDPKPDAKTDGKDKDAK
jgi:hypothetical protein